MKTYWISTPRMTVYATVVDGIVAKCSPIIRKFVGQRFGQLHDWLAKQCQRGEFLIEELP